MSPYERKLNQVHDIFESEIEASDLTEDEKKGWNRQLVSLLSHASRGTSWQSRHIR